MGSNSGGSLRRRIVSTSTTTTNGESKITESSYVPTEHKTQNRETLKDNQKSLPKQNEQPSISKETVTQSSTSTSTATSLPSLFASFLGRCMAWFLANTAAILMHVLSPMYNFFHARTGVAGCRLAGYIRLTYGLLFTYSRMWMAYHIPFLFDPQTGVVPYSVTRWDMDPQWDITVFQLAPESRLLVYGLFGVAIVQGVLLILGIAPRWQAMGIYVFLGNLYNHNGILFDNQEHMLRMWAFFLCWLPLDHVTVYDGFGGWIPWILDKIAGYCTPRRSNEPTHHDDTAADEAATTTNNIPRQSQHQHQSSSSWPMWPFRLWQIYTCLVYVGAGFGKLAQTVWQDGTAIFYIWYDENSLRWFPPFLQDWLFNRLFFVKLQTWLSLAIECLCFMTIWPASTRKLTFAAIVLLHMGIEMALEMHIFEYISVLGWICFFVVPESTTQRQFNESRANSTDVVEDQQQRTTKKKNSWLIGVTRFVESVIAIGLLSLFTIDLMPSDDIQQFMPPPLPNILAGVHFDAFNAIHPFMKMTWLHVGPFTVFSGTPPHTRSRLTAVMQYSNGTSKLWKKPAMSSDLDEWADELYFYLAQEYTNQIDSVPFYASFAMHLAREHSNGGISIDHQNNKQITISDDNELVSISIMSHRKTGVRPPEVMDNWFIPMPRDWTYYDDCQFVLDLRLLRQLETFDDLLHFNPLHPFLLESHCNTYDPQDSELHMMETFLPAYMLNSYTGHLGQRDYELDDDDDDDDEDNWDEEDWDDGADLDEEDWGLHTDLEEDDDED